ncbi:MAG: peptidylprolyl isomerase [Nostocaceae cyanobacterium]|nr:peptidylprolyl isomerase [Nostocaceae cyanobacterium]
MLKTIVITSKDIIGEVKKTGKMPEIIQGIVSCNVIKNNVAEMGIKVESEELQAAADGLRLIKQIPSADATWEWLKQNAMCLDDFEELVYMNLITDKLAQHLLTDKIEPYFFEHQLDYTGVVLYEIVLDDEDLALELFYGIKEGEISFYDVAHEYIDDIELRRKGGYRGIVQRKDLKPEISAAIFAANPPQLLKPIVTAKGVHLILVEEIIQPQLDSELSRKIASDLFDEWLQEQMTQVEIVKSLDDSSLYSNCEENESQQIPN